MSWIIGILLVVAGAIVGFFAARYWLAEHSDEAELNDQVTQTKQQLADYRQEVAEHLATAQALVGQLEETQDKLKAYLHHSADLLQREQEQPSLPFFAEDTMRELRMANKINSEKRKSDDKAASDMPRDYSDKKSGLFK
ncbi:DUF1043 family protein [Pseudidiomarina gelatinasegens]|jgi:uncharacterized membrane-anchored protein YhcB (DUF1043 family)|uniref:Z-ring associated protein G n=1 Tax=Pseudidiomarina gelatinasegens TaxID=2487740 RepID=A0A451GE01_9GAMM|nr:YhcB family protein [Pseudidiomarina gelatinasegens]RWU11154.1 DUF1043 family protein [Pseudidiomarina gelatinasegens]|tara:strand:- start:2264 stop:2680 length:417 start_codon:yes stop_codon:yes gene_type:complete